MKALQPRNNRSPQPTYDREGRREFAVNRAPTSSGTRRRGTFRSFVRARLAVNFASDALSEFKPIIRTKSRIPVTH